MMDDLQWSKGTYVDKQDFADNKNLWLVMKHFWKRPDPNSSEFVSHWVVRLNTKGFFLLLSKILPKGTYTTVSEVGFDDLDEADAYYDEMLRSMWAEAAIKALGIDD